MELLTNQLLMIGDQVSSNRMLDLIDNERNELERLTHYRPCREDKVSTFRTILGQSQIRKTKFGTTALVKHRSTLSRNRKDDKKEITCEDEQKNQEDAPKIKQITTVFDIIGLYKKNKNDGSKFNESHETSKENSAPKINLSKSHRVARTTVLMQSLKKGHVICTCESLDARCKVHNL